MNLETGKMRPGEARHPAESTQDIIALDLPGHLAGVVQVNQSAEKQPGDKSDAEHAVELALLHLAAFFAPRQ